MYKGNAVTLIMYWGRKQIKEAFSSYDTVPKVVVPNQAVEDVVSTVVLPGGRCDVVGSLCAFSAFELGRSLYIVKEVCRLTAIYHWMVYIQRSI